MHLTGCARPGKGAAVRRGLLTSRARFVGYMDADLATPVETLDTVLPLLAQWQVVVGLGGPAGPRSRAAAAHRAVGGMVFRAMAQRVLPGVADTQCGFKFFAGDVARTAARRLRIDGFAFDVELLRAVIDMGCRSRRSRSSGRTGGLHAARAPDGDAHRRGPAPPGPREGDLMAALDSSPGGGSCS